jgi:type I restriction enzyme M protein
VTDKAKSDPNSLIEVPNGGSFDDMLALRGDKEIGDRINKIISELAEANDLQKVIDLADFNDEEKLGKGKEMQDRLSKLVTIFNDLDFRRSRAEGDDLLGDAYEYLMRHFATGVRQVERPVLHAGRSLAGAGEGRRHRPAHAPGPDGL